MCVIRLPNLSPGPYTIQACRSPLTSTPIGTVVLRTEHVHQSTGQGRPHKVRARFIKVKMDGPSGMRWMGYARWWWERNQGPIPKGQMVLHRNGDSLDDSPGNLFLGGPGDKIKLYHALDPEMSARNRQRCSEGTRECNLIRARSRRLLKPLPDHWYPVVDDVMVVIDWPSRGRRFLLERLGAAPVTLPKNGRGAAYAQAAALIGIRLARGRDLAVGVLGAYLRIDPDTGVSRGDRLRMESREIRMFMKTDLWRRAEEMAKLPRRRHQRAM